ncbi:MAG: rRNA maturation RNase YbeY [Anaerolineaceae bacterium]
MIHLMIQDRFAKEYPQELLIQTCEHALKFLGEQDTDITLVVDGDAFIQDLNRQYRGLDTATDVLSFEMGYTDPETNRKYLGDIILSADTIARNAAQNQVSITEETRLLIVHGILHLLGYDHATEQEQKVMWQKQAEVIGAILGHINGLAN